MNNIELIQSLIDSLNALPHRDDVALHAFRTRASMIIRNVFGDKSGHRATMLNIDFHPRVYHLPIAESNYDVAWNSGKKKMLNLLEVMKEEVERFGKEHRKEMKAEKQKQELMISMKEAREQFLIKLYEMSNGDIDEIIKTMSIGDALGFDRETTLSCSAYFEQKGYIQRRDDAYGGMPSASWVVPASGTFRPSPSLISITPAGIDEADRIQSRMGSPPSGEGNLPEEKYFSPA